MTVTDTSYGDFESAASASPAGSSAFTFHIRRIVKVTVPHEREAPRWLTYVLRRLNELSEPLGATSEPDLIKPDPVALARALPELQTILTPLGLRAPAPSVVPTAEFGLQFVWHRAGWDVEVEVGPVQTWVWAQNRSAGTVWEGLLDDRRSELLEVLRMMTGAE